MVTTIEEIGVQAKYYRHLEEGKVRCDLCPHECLIRPGRVGICFVRQNVGGELRALTYGRVAACHLDPIEKKPLYHFYPGSTIFSISGIGCNLGCPFCQNWEIAHPKDHYLKTDPQEVVKIMTQPMSIEDVANQAEDYRKLGNIGVAYTYNEPLIWFEYLLDAAKLVRARGLKNVLVTNGYIKKEPLLELLPYVDAMNIDVKGITNTFYHRLGGRLEPVLEVAEISKNYCHVEITNLLIPTWNTDEQQIQDLVDWVASKLGPETPLHFSRYFPARKLSLPPTPRSDLEKAKAIAEKKLNFVYLGNV